MYGPYLVPNAPTGSDASVNTRIFGTLTKSTSSSRPEISKLHRGADLGSECPPNPVGQSGLSGERMTPLRSQRRLRAPSG